MKKQKRHLKKRIMSIVLSMAMVLGCITVPEKKVHAATELSDGETITADIAEDTIITGKVTLSGDLWLEEGVTLTISEGATLTIPNGSFLRPDGNISGKGVISGEGCIVIYDGSISDCTVYTYTLNAGTIASGTFYGEIKNDIDGTISGGTFNGTVTNMRGSTISGGEFYGTVNNTYNYEGSTICGGTFHSTVTNNGTTISGGTFLEKVTNQNYSEYDYVTGMEKQVVGTSSGGTFNAGIENNGTIAFSDAGNLSISGDVTGSGTITVNGETHVHNTEGGTTYTDITETQHTKNVSCKDCAVKHVEITTEEHSLVYSINGAIISVECSDCDAEGSITIAAPAGDELVYTGNAYEAGYDTPTGLLASETPTITYTGDNLVEGKPVNAGTYIASITVGDKTASVEYTIKQAKPEIGTVTAEMVTNSLDTSKVQLSRTDESNSGTLKLTDSNLKYGTNTYNWKFTPNDVNNYETITGTVEITVTDTEAPTATYQVGTDGWKEFANTITSGMFYKDVKTVEIEANDAVSGVATKQYYVSDTEITDTSNIEWKDYTGAFDLDASNIWYIYVRVVDKAGNEAIYNSDGLVIYTDSVLESETVDYTYKQNENRNVKATWNGNTIKEIKDNDGKVLDTSNYEVSASGELILQSSYLNTLNIGEYTYKIYLNPMNIENDEADLVSTFKVIVKPAELTVSGVVATDKVYDGTNKVSITSVTLAGIVSNENVSVDISALIGTLSNANAGNYTSITLPALTLTGEDVGNYTLVQPTGAVAANVTIAKAENAPNMPATEIDVLYNQKTVADVNLPESWEWKDADKTKSLEIGVPLEATASYNGTDKGNYINESIVIFITRKGCQHTGETEIKNAKVATCKELGYTGDTCCKDCGEKLSAGEEIAKLTNHTWNEGVVTKPATATEKGIKTYTCSVCGETKTEEIPALGVTEIPKDTTPEVPEKEPSKTPTPTTKPEVTKGAPKKGTILTDKKSKAKYKVIVSGVKNGTVEYVKSTNKKATTITIPAKVTIEGITYKVVSIGKNAFKNNKKIIKVTIGSNVKTINANAFYGCKKLKSIKMGKNITTIGNKAFYKCTALTKITILSKVKKIGKQAFFGCEKLKSITIKTTKLTTKNIGSKAFKGIYKKATIKVPKSKVKAYKKMLKTKGIGKQVKVKK